MHAYQPHQAAGRGYTAGISRPHCIVITYNTSIFFKPYSIFFKFPLNDKAGLLRHEGALVCRRRGGSGHGEARQRRARRIDARIRHIQLDTGTFVSFSFAGADFASASLHVYHCGPCGGPIRTPLINSARDLPSPIPRGIPSPECL